MHAFPEPQSAPPTAPQVGVDGGAAGGADDVDWYCLMRMACLVVQCQAASQNLNKRMHVFTCLAWLRGLRYAVWAARYATCARWHTFLRMRMRCAACSIWYCACGIAYVI